MLLTVIYLTVNFPLDLIAGPLTDLPYLFEVATAMLEMAAFTSRAEFPEGKKWTKNGTSACFASCSESLEALGLASLHDSIVRPQRSGSATVPIFEAHCPPTLSQAQPGTSTLSLSQHMIRCCLLLSQTGTGYRLLSGRFRGGSP